MNYHIRSWGAIALAAACWALCTGLAVEKVLADGVQSWTLLAAMPVLTLAVGILLHLGAADIKALRPFRGTAALVLALLALAVTLPASIGSSGGARDTAAAAATKSAEDIAKLQVDLVKTEKLVAEAEKWQAAECASGRGKKCEGLTFILEQRQRSLDGIRAELKEQPAEKPIASGETRIAWVLGLFGFKIQAGDVGLVWPMLPPIVLELMVAYWLTRGLGSVQAKNHVAQEKTTAETMVPDAKTMVPDTAQTDFDVSKLANLPDPVWFGPVQGGPEPVPPKPRRKRKSKHERAQAWLRSEAKKNGGVPSFKVVQGRYHLSKASASRIRNEVVRELEAA